MSRRTVAHSTSAGWLAWFALAVVWTVWGSTYLAIGAAVETVPPLLMAGARYMTAGLLLYAVVSRSYARGAQRPTRRQLRSSVIIGALLLVGGNGLLSVGETMLASGLAALIAATVPVWMVIVNAWVTSTPVAKPTQVALVLGTGGVAVLIGWRGGDPIHLGGALIVLLGSLFWAIGSVYARTADVPKNPLVATSLQMLAGGALLLIAGALTGELGRFQVGAITGTSLLAFLWLVFPGSILAFSAYVYANQKLSNNAVATYAYVNPVIAVVLGTLIGHEAVTINLMVGGAIIVLAVAVIVSDHRRQAREPDAVPDKVGDAATH